MRIIKIYLVSIVLLGVYLLPLPINASEYTGSLNTGNEGGQGIIIPILPPPSSGNTGGGGGGGGGGDRTTYCTDITYSAWNSCVGNQQFRTVVSRLPIGCTLTTAQQISLSRVCQSEVSTTTPEIIDSLDPVSSNDSKVSKTQPSALVLKRTKEVSFEELKLSKKTNLKLVKRLAGYILLQVETKGQAWYLDKVTLNRFYLADGPSAYQALRKFGLGITNADLSKIPVSPKSELPSDYKKSDSNSDALTNRLKGRILLQVEGRGEAWYVNPSDGMRYYLANGDAAYQIMRNLSLGISNDNIRGVNVGEW